MEVKARFDVPTSTLTYTVYDPASRDAVIIDPVMDYDPAASRVCQDAADENIAFIREQGLKLHYILETHCHADHMSGSQLIKREFPQAKIAIGAHIQDVQSLFKRLLGLRQEFAADGSQFDQLLHDGDMVQAGTLTIETMDTPGHTPADVCYKIGEALFTGDAILMPDQGTGRCDFPAGSAAASYRSVTERIYGLPDDTRIFVGHDYQPDGRELRYETTVGEQKTANVQLPADRSEADFVAFRTRRDATLPAPRLLYPSVRINLDAGRLPPQEEEGRRFLKIPLSVA